MVRYKTCCSSLEILFCYAMHLGNSIWKRKTLRFILDLTVKYVYLKYILVVIGNKYSKKTLVAFVTSHSNSIFPASSVFSLSLDMKWSTQDERAGNKSLKIKYHKNQVFKLKLPNRSKRLKFNSSCYLIQTKVKWTLLLNNARQRSRLFPTF